MQSRHAQPGPLSSDGATPLPDFLAEPSRIGEEISITGKWVPTRPGGRRSSELALPAWAELSAAAAKDAGVLSTEFNDVVGKDAVLIHQVFADVGALTRYFATTAAPHMAALADVARPELQLVRAVSVPPAVQEALRAGGMPVAVGELLFGYVRDDYRRPDPEKAVQVTAKWTCKPSEPRLDELTAWWQQVGTEAYDLERGLVRFEVYRVVGEDALIIHETFEDTRELKFHLTKGTAEKYKKDIDQVAAPECYYFRGPVARLIRTYSKFMRLPATYSQLGDQFTVPGGSMSDGRM